MLAKALVRSYISSRNKCSLHGAQIPCNGTIIATKILLQQISNQSIIAIRFITLLDRFPKQKVFSWRVSKEPSILDQKKIGSPIKEFWSSVPKECDIASSLNTFGTVIKKPPSPAADIDWHCSNNVETLLWNKPVIDTQTILPFAQNSSVCTWRPATHLGTFHR